MTTSAWIFMGVVWTVVTLTTAWLFRKVLRSGGLSTHDPEEGP